MEHSKVLDRGAVWVVVMLLFGALVAIPAVPASAAAAVAHDDVYVIPHDNTLTMGADHAFDRTWGSPGGYPGQFDEPRGVAVDAAGYVYVADWGRDRVQKFTTDGTYVTQWGSTGAGESQFHGPQGIAVDSGFVYVADWGNDRVQKFTTDGAYVTQWGTTGTADGQFRSPDGIATDGAGHVYVTEVNGHRVQKFTADGSYVTQWGTQGSGVGQFQGPRGVAVAPSGQVYVVESSRVQKFTADGSYVAQWATVGDGIDVAVDAPGYVYVSELSAHLVHKFTDDGTHLTQWGSEGDGEGQFDYPWGVAVDGYGEVYVAEAVNDRVQVFLPAGVLGNDIDSDGDSLTAGVRSSPDHGSLLFHGDGSFSYTPVDGFHGVDSFTYTAWDGATESNEATVHITVDPGTTPVARDDAYAVIGGDTLNQTAQHVFDLAWGTLGSGDGQFEGAEVLAIDSDGFVYVAEDNNQRVQKFTADGAYITQWGSSGSGNGQFFGPRGIAVDDDGYVFVADGYNHRVQKFTGDGTYITQWGTEGTGDGEFQVPRSIAIDGGGQVLIADSENHRVQRFTGDGAYVTQFGGTFGIGPGEFAYPDGIAVRGDGHILVVDTGGGRVQEFDADGAYVAQWGSRGSGEGQLDQPGGIALDGDGFVYVSDMANSRIQKYTDDGLHLSELGSHGAGAGQLEYPGGIAVTDEGYVYVVDRGNRRVVRFTPAGVLGNDTDADGDSLTAVLVTGPSHGSLALSGDGSFTYTPHLGYHGTDSFTYTVSDGATEADTATVMITVLEGPNNPPTVVDDLYHTTEDTSVTVTAPGVLGNDTEVDIDDTLTASVATVPEHGELELAADGSFTYTPDAGFLGIDSFTYIASDGEMSDTGAVSVHVVLDDPFTDDDGSIFEEDIEWLAALGITKGCNPPVNDRFCPDSYVTRGQMAAFLVRALGYADDGGGDLFEDDDGSIFEGDIDRLGTAGVTRGCNPPLNTMFCPNSYVTRGQMAAFLVRALGYADDGGGDLFEDDDGSIFEGDIDRLGTAGVTRGCNPPLNTMFCPNSYVTRGQMAAFLHRALG